MKLLLFDIDGTLLMSGGAGRTAMDRAFEQIYGFKNGFKDISMMGRTDPMILKDVLDKYSLPWQPDQIVLFQQHYYDFLEEEMASMSSVKTLCPGIRELLMTLDQDQEFVLGLLTGNWKCGAWHKLAHFQIQHYFKLGAYADDDRERSKLVPVAMQRFRELKNQAIEPENVYVIGDTPLDIIAARPHNVKTVGVATGFHDMDSIRKESPDQAFKSFEDVRCVIDYFKGEIFSE